MNDQQKQRADTSCFIIAEAGVNHNGDIEIAKGLIDAAVDARADAVKFQTFRAEELVSADAPKAPYQLETTKAEQSQLEMLKELELSRADHRILIDYCAAKDILFLSTPFDEESADFLDELGMTRFKIASGEITNLSLLRHIARKQKPVILSTGMSTLQEVSDAVRAIEETGNLRLTLLHCVSEYPAPPDQINLRAMLTLREAFPYPAGYSDHTLGISVSLAAAALGAVVVEKHLTLSRSMTGPDHRASLEPAEFKEMVHHIRVIETALGDGRKEPAQCERGTRLTARRSLFAAVDIPRGAVVEIHMLRAKRPGDGISAAQLQDVVGKRVTRDVRAGEKLQWNVLTGSVGDASHSDRNSRLNA